MAASSDVCRLANCDFSKCLASSGAISIGCWGRRGQKGLALNQACSTMCSSAADGHLGTPQCGEAFCNPSYLEGTAAVKIQVCYSLVALCIPAVLFECAGG